MSDYYAFIDFEFKPHPKTPELICAVLRISGWMAGFVETVWLQKPDHGELEHFLYLLRLIKSVKIPIVAFVCDAEAKCLKALGFDPLDFVWMDSHIIGLPYKHSSKEFVKYADKRFSVDKSKFYYNSESSLSESEQLQEWAPEEKKRQAASLLGMYEFFCKKTHEHMHVLESGKEQTRNLILSLDTSEAVPQNIKDKILDYCTSDVLILEELFFKQIDTLTKIEVEHQKAFARFRVQMWDVSYQGLPLNKEVYEELLASHKENIKKEKLALPQFYEYVPARIGPRGGHYKELFTLKESMLEKWIADHNLRETWPKTSTGHWSCSEETLKTFALHTDIEKLLQTKKRIKHLEFFNSESKNCVSNWVTYDEAGQPWQHPEYWTFGTTTGRNAHKPPTFIMGLERNLRPKLLGCPAGQAIIQADFKCQEVWIAGALSGDKNLLACVDNDPYLLFAESAGLAPHGATKQSHGAARDICKQVVLGGFYGLWIENLAKKIGKTFQEAERLYYYNKVFYKTYYAWSKSMIDYHQRSGKIYLADGWPLYDNHNLHGKYAVRTTQNFPIQGTAQVIMRKVIDLFYKYKIRCIYTLHDEFGVLCREEDKDITWSVVKDIMQDACKFYFPAIPPCGVDSKTKS